MNILKFIASWSSNQKDYQRLAMIKRLVDDRITYRNGGYNQWLYVKPGQHVEADCQAFCETYRQDCQNAGYTAERFTYKLPSGVWHCHCVVTTDTATWLLDNLEKVPFKA